MANLKRLIQGQDVRFDTHQAGDMQPTDWKALHLEKILHEGAGKIRFPLVGNHEPNWSSPRISQKNFQRVCAEVKRELNKNKNTTQILALTVADVLTRFSNGTASVKDAEEAAKKLAGYFGLDQQFSRTVCEYMGSRLLSFTSYHSTTDSQFLKKIIISTEKVEIRKSRRKDKKI